MPIYLPTRHLSRHKAHKHSHTYSAFVRAMLRHELPKNAMAVYLVQDYRFLDSFSRLLAAVLCNAAVNLQERRFGASFLALILSDENDYFVQSFKALGVPADERTRKKKFPDQPAADAFISAMDDAADNAAQKPHVAVALLLVCEWVRELAFFFVCVCVESRSSTTQYALA